MGCVKCWLPGLTIDFVYFIEANVDLVRSEAALYTCTSILFAATLSEDLCTYTIFIVSKGYELGSMLQSASHCMHTCMFVQYAIERTKSNLNAGTESINPQHSLYGRIWNTNANNRKVRIFMQQQTSVHASSTLARKPCPRFADPPQSRLQ